MWKRVAWLLPLPLLAWLLWPAANPRFAIVDDLDKLEQKSRFMTAPHETAGARPNIVLILADDLGKHDLDKLATPHIASIGNEGVRFNEGYITSPICAPSRAGLMTGRYQQRFGFELITHERYPRNHLEWYAAQVLATGQGWHAIDQLLVPPSEDIVRQGLPPSELTLAEILKTRGYATGIFGKWHLGFNDGAIPLHRGFDYHYGFLEAFSLYADPHDADIVNARKDLFADRYQWWKGRHGNCAIQRNGQEIDEKVYLTDSIAKEAVAWIKVHNKAPFFAYVPFSAPHAPLQAPRRYVDRFASEPDEGKRVYYAMIAALDDAVGEILDVLDDNTLVIFTSDNGGATYLGVTDNAPLKGGKFTAFEGGINVPMAMRFPGHIVAGTQRDDPVSSLDLFMTAVKAAGADLPGRAYDGIDLLTQQGDRPLYWRSEGHRAIRVGRFKLISDTKTGSRALYDLVADKNEERPLQDAAKTDELEALLRAWETTLVQPKWPRVMDYHFTVGDNAFVFPL